MKKIFLILLCFGTTSQAFCSDKEAKEKIIIDIEINIPEKVKNEIEEMQNYIYQQLNPKGTNFKPTCYGSFSMRFEIDSNKLKQFNGIFTTLNEAIAKNKFNLHLEEIILCKPNLLLIKFDKQSIALLQSISRLFFYLLSKENIISPEQEKNLARFISYIRIGRFDSQYYNKREFKLNSFVKKIINKIYMPKINNFGKLSLKIDYSQLS